MTTLSAHRGYGGKKSWIARITGTHPKFLFNREFLAARENSSRSGATGTVSALITEPGLYETCDTDKKGKDSTFYVVLSNGCFKVSLESAGKLAKILETTDINNLDIDVNRESGKKINWTKLIKDK